MLVLVLVLVALVFADHAFVGTAPNGSLVIKPEDGQEVLVDGISVRALAAAVNTLVAQTRLMGQHLGAFSTCAMLKRFNFTGMFSGKGLYTLYTSSGMPFSAHCNDEGWTLVRNQVDATQYFTYDSPAHALRNASDPGVQEHLDTIIPKSTAMRYTDAQGVIIVEVVMDGSLYWSHVTSSVSACGLVPVQYTKGVLSGATRYMDVGPSAYFGHRHNNNAGVACGAGSADDIRDVYNNNCQHICFDAAGRYRPMYGSSCLSEFPTFCPGYDPPYQFPANAGPADGGFLYQQWVL